LTPYLLRLIFVIPKQTMQDEIFNRIIEALQVKYYRAALREIVKPVELNGSVEPRNILVQVNTGFCYGERDFRRINPGDFYFMPVGSPIYFRHGKSAKYTVLGKEGFNSPQQREQFVKSRSVFKDVNETKDTFSIMGFDVNIYGAIPFFSILELPCFILNSNQKMNDLIREIIVEDESSNIGRTRLLKNLSEELVVHLCRFIHDKPEFRENYNKISYLLDKRLVNIIQYIQASLSEDLSNQKIADQAFVSKDYVGQFFKSLTNTNLQDYIENQRLERANYLLRTTKDNIQEIAHQVGFKDPAYFSRRFKNKYNINANQVRKDNIIAI
jgi:AraC family transcriptional regulator, arabinose operon regulatory protein